MFLYHENEDLSGMPYHMTNDFMVYRWCLTHFFINLFNLLPSS